MKVINLPIPSPRVLLLSAYDAGSHARWRRELTTSLPEYEWHALTLPPRYFRWRIRGNPLSWLDEPLLDEPWDALVVTTMVDLATLRGLKPRLAATPALAYCHENQFAYPLRAQATASIEPQMVNLYTMLSAERVVFNSEWNRRSLLDGVSALLDQFPDRKPVSVQKMIAGKSCVIPVPVRDDLFLAGSGKCSAAPHLIWNHRWEHDKCPDRLLLLLKALTRRAFNFRLSVVGEQFRDHPKAFNAISDEFADCIVAWGYQCMDTYRQVLADSDVVISTALHDFQGLAVLEGMAAGCFPWVPRRLAYPEYVPDRCLYDSFEDDHFAEAEAAADGLIALWQAIQSGKLAPVSPDNYRSSRLLLDYRRELECLLSGACARVGPETL